MKCLYVHVQRALCALWLFCLSSCSETCRQWTVADTVTCCPCYNSGRMYLEPESDFQHLELELDRSSSGIRMYLNLLLFPAPPAPNDPNRAVAVLTFNNASVEFYPYRLSGGQRLLVPDDTTQSIIDILSKGLACTIKIGREELIVISDNFDACYQHLMELPLSERNSCL